jgi:Cu/Ag efflux protein CusF
METNPMNTRSMNTTIRLKIQVALLAIAALALLPTIATAHGGEEHVTGTVTKISATSVTVKTTDGKIKTVGFDAKTTYTRGREAIQKTDIKVGDKMVIHAEEVNEKLVAHTVEIGAATAAKPAAK